MRRLPALLAVLAIGYLWPSAQAGLLMLSNGGRGVSTTDDWALRSTGLNVLRAVRFGTQSELDSEVFGDVMADHVTWDTSVKPQGATGSAKIAVLNGDGPNNGALLFYLANDHRVFGAAQSSKEYYVQFRQRGPANFIHAVFPGGNGLGHCDGLKHSILSWHGSSNPGNAVVVEDSYSVGGPSWYYYDGSSGQFPYPPISSIGFRLQPNVDAGAPTVTNYATATQRYGAIQGYPADDGVNEYTGTPTLPTAGFAYTADEWFTVEEHVDFSSGFGSSHVEIWFAHENSPAVKIVDDTVVIGSQNGGHDTAWLLPYCTNRTSNGGYDTATWYAEIITSTGEIPMPGQNGASLP